MVGSFAVAWRRPGLTTTQKLINARISAQAITVGLIVGAILLTQTDPEHPVEKVSLRRLYLLAIHSTLADRLVAFHVQTVRGSLVGGHGRRDGEGEGRASAGEGSAAESSREVQGGAEVSF